MKPKLTREEAQSMLEAMSVDERIVFDTVKTARDAVRKRDGKVSRAAVRAQAGLGNDAVVLNLRILEAIEVDERPYATEASPANRPLHPTLASALADAKSFAERLEASVGIAVDETVRQEQERTRAALDSRIAAAEANVLAMADRANDFQETAEDLAASSVLQKEIIARLEKELSAAQNEIDTWSGRSESVGKTNADLATRLDAMRERNADLEGINSVLAAELEQVRNERDALTESAALLAEARTERAVAQEQRDALVRESVQYAAVLRDIRENHQREIARLCEEHRDQLAAERARVDSFESGIVNALKAANVGVVSPPYRT